MHDNARLAGATWAQASMWAQNLAHTRTLLGVTASELGHSSVSQTLTDALADDGTLVSVMLVGCAETIEHRDSLDFARFTGIGYRYSETPNWLPIDAIVTAIGRQPALPSVADFGIDDSSLRELARQVTDLHPQSPSTT
jgi:hypothetical protein